MRANPDQVPAGVSRPAQGRKAVITRDHILRAAQKLLGPHRSISSLSLREVTREAGIAPNSFYRHFHDMDELAVALIDNAGASVRELIRRARTLAASGSDSVVVSSVNAFMAQLDPDEKLLHILLREGTVGSDAFKAAVEQVLINFEEELRADLIRLANARGRAIHRPDVAAKAITRVVFALGGTALDSPDEQRAAIREQMIAIVRMILAGAETMAMAEDG